MMFTNKIMVASGSFPVCCIYALEHEEPEAEPWECPTCHSVGKLVDGVWELDLEASLENMARHRKLMLQSNL